MKLITRYKIGNIELASLWENSPRLNFLCYTYMRGILGLNAYTISAFFYLTGYKIRS